MKKVLILVMALCMGLTASVWSQQNQVLYQRWENFTGGIAGVKQNIADGVAPTVTEYLDSWTYPSFGDNLNNFATHTHAWLIAPADGSYTFYVASDDGSELWLSSDDDPANVGATSICRVDEWTDVRQWDKYPAVQKSAAKTLQAGKVYYMETFQTEGTGGDSISVGWTGPDPVPATIANGSGEIPGTYLYAYNPYYAGGPNPADGAVNVEQNITEVSFGTPAARTDVSWNVYLGVDPNTWTQVAADSTSSTVDISSLTLEYNTKYFWRVDIIDVNEVTQVEDIVECDLWSFTTKPKTPAIITPLSGSVKFGVSDSGSLSFAYTSDTAVSEIVWKKDGAIIASGDADFTTLTLEDLVDDDAGMYTAEVTNTAGTSVTGPVEVTLGHMIGYWPFDDDAQDHSGSNNHGTLMGSASLSEGKFGNALSLDGATSNYCDINKMASELGIDGNKPRTVSVWAYFNPEATWGNAGLFDVGTRADTQNFSLRCLADAKNRFRIQYWGGDYDFTTTTDFGFTCIGNWVHFVHVHDGTHTKIYANGNLIVDWAKTINTTDGFTFRIGAYGTVEATWNGLLDEVQLYDYAMTARRIMQEHVNDTGEPQCWEGPAGLDYDNDCVIGLGDLMMVLEQWTACNLYPLDLCD